MKKQSLITLSVLASLLFGSRCLADDSASAELQKLEQSYKTDPGATVWSNTRAEPTDSEAKRDYADKALAIAKAHPSSEVGEDALIWLIAVAPAYFDTTPACKIIEKDYFKSEKLAALCWSLMTGAKTASKEHLLTQLMNESPSESVRAHATFCLALFKLPTDPNLSIKLLQKVADKYPSIQVVGPVNRPNVGAIPIATLAKATAQRLLAKPGDTPEQEHFKVGTQAPAVVGTDADGKAMKLEDFRGKIVMLDFFGDW